MFTRLRFLTPVALFFALVMAFSGCDPVFDDKESANFANSETPNTPRNIQKMGLSSTSIRIWWDPVPGCTDYKVYWYDEADDKYYLAQNQIKDTWYVDDVNLQPDTEYIYRVAAYSNGKFFRESPMSADIRVKTLAAGAAPVEPDILDPPTNVQAASSSPTSILVYGWNVVTGATGYNVYSSDSADGDYTYRAFVQATQMSIGWMDNDCHPGQTKYYKVTTLSGYGEGEKSDAVSATTETVSNIPGTPAGINADPDGTTIAITWGHVSGAEYYKVYRSTSGEEGYQYVGSPYSNSYTDMGLQAYTTYYYQVSAGNSYGESARSTSASATTGAGGGGVDDGSSAAKALTFSPGIWMNGNLDDNFHAVWYKFTILDGSSIHCLMGKDIYGYGAPYTGDVSFEIYDSGLNLIENLDAGNGGTFDQPLGTNGFNYKKGTWTAGTWYVKVIPYGGNYESYKGSYAIYFY